MSRLSYRSSLTAITIAIIFLFPAGALPAGEGEKLPFEPGDTLEEIRYKIDYNGYDFTVAENRISRMSREEKDKLLGRHRPRFTGKKVASTGPGPLIEELGKRALPSSFDWRNYNGHSYIGPIRDQDPCGSCWAFAACAAAEGTYNWAMGLYDNNCADFSESYMMWCLGSILPYSDHFGGCDQGADWDYYELLALTNAGTTSRDGVCADSNFPYQSTAPASCTPYLAYPRVLFNSWHRVACLDIDAIKTAIMTYGVVDAAVDVTTAFENYSGGVFQDTSTTCPGDAGGTGPECYYTYTNHAISLVGWDDNPPEGGGGCWILRNSWNTDWGENGYMRIRYTSARVACEVAYLVYGSTPPPASDYRVMAGGDYNGDGNDDIAIFRPSSGLWSVRNITRVYWGTSGDIPIPGDYDGNGTTRLGIFRPSSGLWAIQGYVRFYYGSSSDTPVPNDYTGTGRCNPGIFRPSSGLWSIYNTTRCYFGGSSDKPVPADYNGDGTSQICIFRESSGLWACRNSFRAYFGTSGDIPYALDPYAYAAGIGIYRPSTGLWAINGYSRFYFGGSSDQPVPANFIGDAGDDIAIFRQSSGLWAIQGGNRYYYGANGDIPVTR
jgi:C1A family cysteine protease